MFHTYLLRDTTVLVELWPPHIFYVRFRDNKFLRMGSSTPRPTPNLEDQGISLSLAPPSKPRCTSCLTQQQRAFDKVQLCFLQKHIIGHLNNLCPTLFHFIIFRFTHLDLCYFSGIKLLLSCIRFTSTL
jgi:hypothetical protein